MSNNRRKRVTVALAATAICGTAAFASHGNSAAAARTDVRANPYGIQVMLFAEGTSQAAIRAAVAASGATVTTDLSQIRAMAVLPNKASAKLATNRAVKAVWVDRFVALSPADRDAAAGATAEAPAAAATATDPFHDAPSFAGETNPEGILQWDDNRMNVAPAWARTKGDPAIKVAVLDTGVQGSHRELKEHYLNQDSVNTIPCHLLTRQFGPQLGERDCSAEDTNGHGTWVASRIGGNLNGFGSNGVAPRVSVMGVKVLSTTLGGGLTTWIVDGMVRSCDAGAHLINMSLGGFNDPEFKEDRLDTFLWVLGAQYCNGKGTAILASAGNSHVRIHRRNGFALDLSDVGLGTQTFNNIGQVDEGNDGIAGSPGVPLVRYRTDLRNMIETPAGIPGVIMVSSTGNAAGPGPTDSLAQAITAAGFAPSGYWGKKDQLAYYSNYGSRIDITAPGGARKYGLPRFDVGPANILYGGWGTIGATDASSETCTDPAIASLLTFACFKVQGQGFAWLQGTSMSAPNATGVAALALSAKSNLRRNPAGLLAHLKATARKDMINLVPPSGTAFTVTRTGAPCDTMFCSLDFSLPAISFADAYGAGMVDAAKATE